MEEDKKNEEGEVEREEEGKMWVWECLKLGERWGIMFGKLVREGVWWLLVLWRGGYMWEVYGLC